MYNSYKVKVFIFAGREQTMKLLMSQLKSDYIDEIIIAKNTNVLSDLKYLDSLKDNFDKIKYIELPAEIKRDNHKAWKYLYNFMQDEDSIYFKMDDDIIFIEPDYFEKTLEYKINHPEILCVFPVIVNNPYCCTLLKEHPLMFSNYNNYDMMNAYFYSGKYGAQLHELFLLDPTNKRWKIKDHVFGKEGVYFKNKNHEENVTRKVPWDYAERIGINSICYFGKDFKKLNIAKNITECYSDELYLVYNIFKRTSQKHCVLGNTLISHFAFSGQKGLRERNDILDEYKKLIEITYGTKC